MWADVIKHQQFWSLYIFGMQSIMKINENWNSHEKYILWWLHNFFVCVRSKPLGNWFIQYFKNLTPKQVLESLLVGPISKPISFYKCGDGPPD